MSTLKAELTIRCETSLKPNLRKIARRRKERPGTMVRRWIWERIELENSTPAPAAAA